MYSSLLQWQSHVILFFTLWLPIHSDWNPNFKKPQSCRFLSPWHTAILYHGAIWPLMYSTCICISHWPVLLSWHVKWSIFISAILMDYRKSMNPKQIFTLSLEEIIVFWQIFFSSQKSWQNGLCQLVFFSQEQCYLILLRQMFEIWLICPNFTFTITTGLFYSMKTMILLNLQRKWQISIRELLSNNSTFI